MNPILPLLRKLILVLSLLLSTMAGNAQDTLKFEFMQHYDMHKNMPDAGYKTISWNNGMLTLGACNSIDNKGGICLSFIDTTGILVWKKVYFHDESTIIQGNYILAFNTSSFYVTGITYKQETEEFDAFFAKFNAQGDSLFFRHYPETGVTYPLGFYHTGPDTLLIVNGCKDDIDNLYNSYAIWDMDTLGNYLEVYESPLTMKYVDQLFRKNNRYYVGGTERTTPSGSYHVKVFIDVFDSSFNPIANWHPSNTMNEYFKELFIWNNKLYLASEVSDYNPPNPNQFSRLRIGHYDDGYYHSSTTFGPFSFTIYWSNVIAADEKSLVLTNWTDGLSNFYFLDTLLRTITTSPFDYYPGVNQGNGNICLMPGKKIGGTGTIYYQTTGSNTQDHFSFLSENVIPFLSLVTGVHDILPDSDTKGISFYPNPFSNRLFVKLPVDGETYSIIIHSISGQQVLETTAQDLKMLDTNTLPAGAYIVNIISGTDRQAFKVMKLLGYH